MRISIKNAGSPLCCPQPGINAKLKHKENVYVYAVTSGVALLNLCQERVLVAMLMSLEETSLALESFRSDTSA